MNDSYCPRCNRSSLAPTNRLITEKCGHVKCRECFINDFNGCHECSRQLIQPTADGEPSLSSRVAPDVPNCESLIDFESDSGELCIDTEVDDSTTFEGPPAPSVPVELDSIPSDTNDNVNVIHNYSTQENQEQANESEDSLKILEEYIIAPKSKIEKFFRATKSTPAPTTCQTERKKALPEHVSKIVENGETQYKCNVCGKKFRSRNQQYYHAYCGNDEGKPYRCKVCFKNFSTSSHLNYHLKTHNDTTKYPCNLCPKTFMRSISLKSHKRTHDGLFRFKCKECGLGFNERKSFTAHINKHRNILPFACKICGKKFSFKSNLTQHQKIHTGLGKRFRCNDCGKEFLRKNSYKEHLVRHSKVKTFQCKLCQTFFIDRKTLERHMNTHGSKVYKCPCCDVKCGRKDNLVRHIRNMHPNENLPDILKNVKTVIVSNKNNTKSTDNDSEITSSANSSNPSTDENSEHQNDANQQNDNQQPIVVSTSVIRSIGNVKPVLIPNGCDVDSTLTRTEAIESDSAPNNTNSNSDNNESEQTVAPAKDTKKPKKKYDPCEIYRKILFSDNDYDDSVLESEELCSDSKDDHIGCCDLNTVINDVGVDSIGPNSVNITRVDNVTASNFAEIHWRKRTSQSFYTAL